MYKNLIILFSSFGRILLYCIGVLVAGAAWWYFTDLQPMFGNYGNIYTSVDIALSMCIIFGFPLFLLIFGYRIWYFGCPKKSSQTLGLFSGIVGTIISGSSCCGVTIASSLGFLSVLTFLPFHGMEIKILAVGGLVYAITTTLKTLQTCVFSPKK